MRNFTPETETQLLKQFGTEPMIVIAVDWVQDGNLSFYTDRAVTGQPVEGRILDISTLDNVFILEDNSDSKEISFTLDDSDGILKDIINNNDIHGRPVSVFHWDASTPIDNRALLFNGVLNSPITWDEGDRTLKCTVLNIIEDAEYGFSLDESLGIANQPLGLQGKAWPLCFGKVINVPALLLTDLVEGRLETGVGIRDFTLVPKYNYVSGCGKCISCRQGSTFDLDTFVSTPAFGPCSNCNRRVCVALRKLELQINQQTNLEFSTIEITGAARFPQGVVITLEIDGALFTGVFEGTDDSPSTTFRINIREHAKFSEVGATSATTVAATINDEIQNLIDVNCGPANRDFVVLGNVCDGIPLDTDGLPQEQAKGVEDFWRIFNAWPTPGFQFIDPGASVTLIGGSDHTYVANLIETGIDSEGLSSFTQILRVKARKKIGQATRLVDVPDSFYRLRGINWGPYTTTEIVFPRLLSTIDPEWEDDIFVTLISPVGPDIVEVLEWLIDTYTSFTVNAASFASVKLDLAGWEANFALLKRGNILDLLRDIAFQARCALYIKDNEIFLQFLAKRPTIDDTITESDVENNSLSLGHTTTEDLVTKLVADWQFDYSQAEKVKTILRFNVAKYGLKEKVYDFFIFNNEAMVQQASLFWLIRKAQVWRRVRFTTPIQKLQLETFDNIEVTFSDFSPANILAYIEKASYDSSDFSISFDCWTPVRSGEQTEYDFAFPEDVDIDTFFPLQDDLDSGAFDTSAPGALVVAPISPDPDSPNHPLSGNTSCDGSIGQIGDQIRGCFNSRFGRDEEIDKDPSEDDAPTGDVPNAETPSCETSGSTLSQSTLGESTGDGTGGSTEGSTEGFGDSTLSASLGSSGGDVKDSTGTIISQSVETISSFSISTGSVDCDDPHDENSDDIGGLGDPKDALALEDGDNDPDNDGCNAPSCPDASPCGADGTSSCVASVNVGLKFYGIKLVGQVIATETFMDQYCFNSDSAAQDFFDKMVIIMAAQPKPAVGDTQIVVNPLSIVFSNQGICQDTNNPREDAELISFRHFGPLNFFSGGIPACNQAHDPEKDAPLPPCTTPDYL